MSTTFHCEEPGEHGNLRTDKWQDNWEPLGKLGEVNSGEVHKVKSKDSGEVFVLKLIRRGVGDREALAEEELSLLKRVGHIHIVSLVGSFTSPGFFGLLMMPAAQYNLDRYLSEAATDPHKISSLRTYFGCLVNALCHLHYMAYVRHNDIKPQNILVDGSRVLLTDFGISLDWSETLRTTTFGPAPMTSMYSGPEVTDEDQSRSTFSDIWSLGCVFLEMITVIKGRSIHDLRQYLSQRPTSSSAYSHNLFRVSQWIRSLGADVNGPEEQLLNMVENMIAENTQSRPTAERLRTEMLDFDAEQSFFGDCCITRSRTEKELKTPIPQEEIADEFPIEQHTSIAAVSWTGEQFHLPAHSDLSQGHAIFVVYSC
ncbi:hypothetical protein BFW01_g505 [Lasiodiplodia theobromae]|nr:hypothetical protein BFW01_g505 [Lasiodiplodia theobromae]